jgi:hypothetical protein
MKRTLAHSPVALVALMTWYPLRDAVLDEYLWPYRKGDIEIRLRHQG